MAGAALGSTSICTIEAAQADLAREIENGRLEIEDSAKAAVADVRAAYTVGRSKPPDPSKRGMGVGGGGGGKGAAE